VLPSGRSAEVERIVTWDGDLAEAHAPLSVTLVLNHELDISRGDILVSSESPATVAKKLKAALVWMDQRPLDRNRRYLLKHTSHTVPAHVSAIEHRTDIGTLSHEPADTLEMNGIGVVSIELLRPIAIDLYGKNRSTGAFILIDPETNSTVAAGMVTATSEDVATSAVALGRVTAEERLARWGHRGGVLKLNGPEALIDAIERSLFTTGAITGRIDIGDSYLADSEELREQLLQLYVQSGLIALVATISDGSELTARAGDEVLALDTSDFNSGPNAVVAVVHQLLVRAGLLLASGKAGTL
jgi:hypothetical protein